MVFAFDSVECVQSVFYLITKGIFACVVDVVSGSVEEADGPLYEYDEMVLTYCLLCKVPVGWLECFDKQVLTVAASNVWCVGVTSMRSPMCASVVQSPLVAAELNFLLCSTGGKAARNDAR